MSDTSASLETESRQNTSVSLRLRQSRRKGRDRQTPGKTLGAFEPAVDALVSPRELSAELIPPDQYLMTVGAVEPDCLGARKNGPVAGGAVRERESFWHPCLSFKADFA